MAAAPLARLADVSFSYDNGATWALSGVDFEVRPGEAVCVLGANGSGKSTLARLVAGLAAPDAGAVELMGARCFSAATGADGAAYQAARRRISYVFQNPDDQIVTDIVEEDVAFGPENLCVPADKIGALVAGELDRVGMGAFSLANPAKLSGGQQQRVALAGALAMRPDLLVLDEPGSLLDVRGRRGIARVLAGLKAAGVACVHVTHFMEDAWAADRVVVMAAGRVALDAAPDAVFEDPRRLVELGLEPPFALTLSGMLAERGVDVPACATREALVDALAEVLA
jgi:energy-coupling factor transport system ATP-binding protein